MKTIKSNKVVAVLGLVVILSILVIGCDQILTEDPQTFLTEENVFETEDGAISATLGIYAQLRYYDDGNGFVSFLIGNADYGLGRGSKAPVGIYQIDATNENRMGQIWSEIYEKINRSNIVIEKLAGNDVVSSGLSQQLTAEARFLRALGYFHLVRLWGGVPLRLLPPADLDELALGRASVEEVYNQIIEDLQFAESNLPSSYSDEFLGRATSWAAKTLLADVYLTREQWSNAANKAREVIDPGQFELVRVETSQDFHNKIFGPDIDTHSEEILSIKYNQNQEFGLLHDLHRPEAGYSATGAYAWHGNLDSFIGKGEWESEDSPDLRRNNTLYHGEDTQYLDENIQMLFSKFRATPTNMTNDYPIYRYTEVLLILAEATSEANGGPTPESYEALNMVHRRAYGEDPNIANPEIDFSDLSREEFRDTVLLERAKEFVLEGKRWFDLLRTNTALEVIQPLGLPITEKNLKWPIPQEEIGNNEALSQDDQNPGW